MNTELVIVYVALAGLLIIDSLSLILMIIALNKIIALSIPRRTPEMLQMNMPEAYPTMFVPHRSVPIDSLRNSSQDGATAVRAADSLAFCRKCAAELNPDDRFCPKCGLPR